MLGRLFCACALKAWA